MITATRLVRREIRPCAQKGRSCEHRDETERCHDLGVGPDGDDGGGRGAGKRECQAEFDRDQAIETRGADEADRDDRQSERREDVTEEPIAALDEYGTAGETGGAGNKADEHPTLGADPVPAEGEAQEEDRTENEGDAPDPGQGPPGEALLEIGQRLGELREHRSCSCWGDHFRLQIMNLRGAGEARVGRNPRGRWDPPDEGSGCRLVACTVRLLLSDRRHCK